jgi:hypothetical protein
MLGSGNIGPPLFIWLIDPSELSASRSCRFSPIQTSGTQFYRRPNGLQSRSGRYEEEKNILLLPGIESRSLDHPFLSLMAKKTELFQLCKFASSYTIYYYTILH